MLELQNTVFQESQTTAYLDASIELEFNVNLDETTVVAEDTVKLYVTSSNQRLAVATSVADNVLTVSPDPVFPPNTTLSIVVLRGSGGVKGIGGEELEDNLIIEFKTEDKLLPPGLGGEADTSDPEDTAEDIDFITEAITGEETNIVVPDVSPQGDVQSFTPCPPFDGIDAGTEVVTSTESGIPSTVVTSKLSLLGSIPEEFEVGISDISEIVLVWSEDIIGNIDYPLSMTYQDLPVPEDPFSSTTVPHSGLPIIIESSITQPFEVSEIDPTNKEFTVIVKAGNLSNTDDSKTNMTERIVFSGPLEPVLCTIDQVMANAGMWDTEFTKKDTYYYYKLIHDISVFAIGCAGYDDISEVPEDELTRIRRYVCCSAALRMIVFGGGDEKSTPGTTDVYVKKRDLPGVSMTYGLITGGAVDNEDSPKTQVLRRLIDCIRTNAPPCDTEPGISPYIIKYGTKSKYDPSRPFRRRL